MKRIAITIAVAAIAVGATATTAAARCMGCGPDERGVEAVGTAITQDQQAQAPSPADQYSSYPQIDISIDEAILAAQVAAETAKAKFGTLDVAIATALAAGERHVALVPDAGSVPKAKKAKAKTQKKDSRPAKVVYRGPH
jgi:hypothetical protein